MTGALRFWFNEKMKTTGRSGRRPILAAIFLAAAMAPLCLAGGPTAKKSDLALPSAAPKPVVRQYVIFVLTTESRIPKRYIVRYNGNQLTTVTPLSMYFNNNRLQLYDADLKVARHP